MWSVYSETRKLKEYEAIIAISLQFKIGVVYLQHLLRHPPHDAMVTGDSYDVTSMTTSMATSFCFICCAISTMWSIGLICLDMTRDSIQGTSEQLMDRDFAWYMGNLEIRKISKFHYQCR
jgi:hypothetical protein